MDPALLSRLQMLGANDGGGGGGGGGAIKCAGYRPPTPIGALEQYHQKIWENLSFTDKQLMPGVGQFAMLPTMNNNSLLARLIAEVFADIFQSVSDCGMDYFANTNLTEEEKQKLQTMLDAVGRLDDVFGGMEMQGSGWRPSVPSALEGNGQLSV